MLSVWDWTTTTELIKLLKYVEFGASGRTRVISLRIGEEFISEPEITLCSTGDGCAGAEVCLEIKRAKEASNGRAE